MSVTDSSADMFHEPEPGPSAWADRAPSTRGAPGGNYADLAARVVRLERALLSRSLVGQAQGVLMERHALTAEQAMTRLHAMVTTSGAELREVATQVIGEGTRFGPS